MTVQRIVNKYPCGEKTHQRVSAFDDLTNMRASNPLFPGASDSRFYAELLTPTCRQRFDLLLHPMVRRN